MRNFKTISLSLLIGAFAFISWTNPVVEKEVPPFYDNEIQNILTQIEGINQTHGLEINVTHQEIEELQSLKQLNKANFACYTQEFLAGLISCFGPITTTECKHYNVQAPNTIINTVDLLWVLAHLCP